MKKSISDVVSAGIASSVDPLTAYSPVGYRMTVRFVRIETIRQSVFGVQRIFAFVQDIEQNSGFGDAALTGEGGWNRMLAFQRGRYERYEGESVDCG